MMPSTFTSLNQAGRDTLEQTLIQRELQRRFMEEQTKLQRQALLDGVNLQMRVNSDRRAAEGLDLQKANAEESRRRWETEQAARQAKVDADTRQDRNKAGVIDMIRQAGPNANPWDLQMLGLEAGLPPNRVLPPKPEETRAQRDERIRGDVLAREQAEADAARRFPKPAKPTKPVKDKPGLPMGFQAAIRNRVGTTGFANPTEAAKSIEAKWPEWRRNYPGLSLSAVKTFLGDVYGTRPKGDNDLYGLDVNELQSGVDRLMFGTPQP